MPSRFFDYESDLLHVGRKSENKPKTGYRRSDEASRSRQSSTSESTSTTTTRSSFSSSTTTSGMLSANWKAAHNPSRSTGALVTGSHNMRDPSREEQMEPTAQVQEWAHQMHLTQQKQYWWCSSCYPKSPSLQIPSDKAMRKVRIVEPTHAYE